MRSARLLTMTISSIHFQKAEVEFAEKHNFRTERKEPEYLLEKQYRKTNEYLKLNDPKELYQEQLKLRTQNHARGFAPKLKDVYWEAVVNLDEHHTLADVKKVADFIQQKYHLQTCSIAVHHDEGYTDKDGAVKYNHHAHLCFLTMDNGISTMRKIRSKELRQMQSEVAQLLGLERGKENSKATRLDHKQYREKAKELAQKEHELATEKSINQVLAQQIKDRHQDNLTLQEQKKIVEAERKKYKEEADHIASEYRALQALNKTLHTQEELDQALAALRKDYEDRLKKEADEAVQLRADDVEKINTLNSTVKQLQNENEELKNAVNVYKNQSNDFLDRYNNELEIHQKLQEENKELKAQLEAVTQERDYLSEFNSTVLKVIQAMYSEFDIEHPVQSLKKIYIAWKSQHQKSSVTPQKRSQTNEDTTQPQRIEENPQSQSMSVLNTSKPKERFYVDVLPGMYNCQMTLQDIKEEYQTRIEEGDDVKTTQDFMKQALAQQCTADELKTVLSYVLGQEQTQAPQQKQSLFARVKHSFER